MRGVPIAAFLKDRILYVCLFVIAILISTGFMLLEMARLKGNVDMSTIPYFIIISLFFLSLWLVADYVRQRKYYGEIYEAIQRGDELQASVIVQSAVTEEQQLISQLLKKQYTAYMNELISYRRKQEMHNYFVLQWVHQMKTPVSVIDLLAQEVIHQATFTNDDKKQLSLSIQEETERITRGLEMMLYTARLDKFEIDLQPEKVPLHELVRGVVNTHKRLCIRHSIFPRIDGEAMVETDDKWMSFVVNQLVSNAIKYSKGKPGTKKLVFQLKQSHDGGGTLRIKDEGIGIASHDLPRIFDPFFTGQNGRMAGESTGMGLYLAKQVCSRLGHRLSVSSELGEGTTFIIHFDGSGIHKSIDSM